MSDEQEELQQEEIQQEPVAEEAQDAPKESDPAPDETDGTETAAQEDKAEDEEKPKPRRSAAKRIGQLTAEKRAAEREIEQLRAALEARQSTPEQAVKAPSRDDFDDYEDYLEAKAAHAAEQVATQRIAVAEQQQQEMQRAQAEEKQVAAYQEARETLIEKGESSYDDFEDVALNDELPVSAAIAEAALVSDRGADVLYYLGKNPKLAERIASMEPIKQLLEFGKLETSVSQPKQSSNAPKPTTPVSQRGAPTNQLRDNISPEEWIKRRREAIRKNSA